MSLEAQAKMLRVIEEGRLERVGSSTGRPIPVNVRILAATNKNLPEEIRHGRFRERERDEGSDREISFSRQWAGGRE